MTDTVFLLVYEYLTGEYYPVDDMWEVLGFYKNLEEAQKIANIHLQKQVRRWQGFPQKLLDNPADFHWNEEAIEKDGEAECWWNDYCYTVRKMPIL